MKLSKPYHLLGALAASLLLATQANAVTVVTSFSILQDMVKQVGGDKVDVLNLVKPDSDIHHYEFTPDDLKKFSAKNDVKVFFTNGLGLDTWSDKVVKATNYSGKVVAVSDGIKTRMFKENILGENGEIMAAKEDEHDEHDHHEHEGHDQHDHEGHDHHHDHDEHEQHNHKGHEHHHDHDEHNQHNHEGHDHHEHEGHHHHHHGVDPHAWQSLTNAHIYVDNIAKTLASVDAANADFYTKNAQQYKQALKALDDEFKPQFAKLPANHRYLVTSHESLGYFADDYGLTVLTPLGFSDDAEPSAKDVATVIKAIRAKNIPAVFLENSKNPAVIKQIATEAKVKVGATLYTDALSAKGEGSTYLGMMKANTKAILEALR